MVAPLFGERWGLWPLRAGPTLYVWAHPTCLRSCTLSSKQPARGAAAADYLVQTWLIQLPGGDRVHWPHTERSAMLLIGMPSSSNGETDSPLSSPMPFRSGDANGRSV